MESEGRMNESQNTGAARENDNKKIESIENLLEACRDLQNEHPFAGLISLALLPLKHQPQIVLASGGYFARLNCFANIEGEPRQGWRTQSLVFSVDAYHLEAVLA